MQKKSKRSLPGRILDFFLKSLIVSSLCAFTTAIYKKIARSITGAVFASYEWISEKLMESTIVKRILPDRRARDIDSPIVRISKLYDSSLCSIIVHKIKWAFLTCQLNVLAIFGLTFGLSSALMLILENFAFSKKIIDEQLGENASIAFVTTDFHVFRAGRVARKAGLDAVGLAAPDVWYIRINNFLRECVGITVYALRGDI